MPHLCPLCRKPFASRAALKHHLRCRVKLAEWHVCDICDEKFCNSHGLEQHRIHKHELTCGTCKEKFNGRVALRKHRVMRWHCPHEVGGENTGANGGDGRESEDEEDEEWCDAVEYCHGTDGWVVSFFLGYIVTMVFFECLN
jgi:hypothetical protein